MSSRQDHKSKLVSFASFELHVSLSFSLVYECLFLYHLYSSRTKRAKQTTIVSIMKDSRLRTSALLKCAVRDILQCLHPDKPTNATMKGMF